MRITWDPKTSNAYAAVEEIVLHEFAYSNESFVVQMRIKYGNEGDDEWRDITELLLKDGNFTYAWENDWWEGEDDVELIAAAPISYVIIDEEWQFVEVSHDSTQD